MTAVLASPASIDRPLGATENLYWLLDQLYCLNFVAFAEIEGRLDEQRLGAALLAVQGENPLLRACIVASGVQRRFKAVAQSAAPMRPQKLPLREWRRQIEQQLHEPFDTLGAPLARLLWFQGSGRKSVLAMVFHHAIADGRSGATVLLDVLRRAAADGTPVLPTYKPARASSQDLDPIRQHTPLGAALAQTRFWLARGKDAMRATAQLPGYDPQPTASRKVRALAFELDAPTMSALHAQARQHGTTVHGALGAAQLMALNDQFPSAQARNLALTSLADLRAAMAGGLSDADLGLYIATLCTVHAMPPKPRFWALAREIRDALSATLDAGEGNLIHGVHPAGLALPSSAGTARWLQTIIAAAPASSMLTNIGRIEQVDLGAALALKSVAFLVAPPPQHPVCVTAASYGGRLFMNLLFDELKLGTKQASEIGHALVAHLHDAAMGSAASAGR